MRRRIRALSLLLAAASAVDLHAVCCTLCIRPWRCFSSSSRTGSGWRLGERQRLQLLQRAAGSQAGRQRQQVVAPAATKQFRNAVFNAAATQ